MNARPSISINIHVLTVFSCLALMAKCGVANEGGYLEVYALGQSGGAASLIESMDVDVDPCQDFYSYACGGWIKNNPIPETKSRWSQIDVLRDRVVDDIKNILQRENDARDPKPLNSAKIMYRACMNSRAIQALGLKPLIDLLREYGGWPITRSIQEQVNFDWKMFTASVRNQYRASYLLAVYNDLDNYDTQLKSIYVDQASLTLPRAILLNPGGYPKVMETYAAYVVGSAKLFRNAEGGNANDAQIESDVQDLLRFEYELAIITTPAEERRNSTRMYNPMLLNDIQSWTDGFSFETQQANINWFEYLNTIYRAANIQIPTNERIIVVEREYIQNLLALLDRTPTRIVANYLLWRIVRLLSPLTSNPMNSLAINFSRALYGSPQSEPRSNNCANEINSLLGFAVSAKYIENNFEEGVKSEIETMITHLKDAFVTLIEEATWMDPTTKAIAKDKSQAMTSLVAYPEWIKNKNSLEAYYNGLVVNENQHFTNIRNVNTLLARQELASLRRSSSRNTWITFPSIVNAYYAPRFNSITFPAGILQPPYFGLQDRSAAINFGGIGTVIGHEITHGFDDRGRQYDKYGNTVSWWTDETLSQYLLRADCFIDKYNNYVVLNGTRLNGVTSLGENIADYGGVREAFTAYRSYISMRGADPPLPGLENFTSEQIFFLSYANVYCGSETPEKLLNQIITGPHSPNRFRVIGTLSNSEDFVREFNCPVGSPMNQLNKCFMWR